jgi:hypothetical protein
VNSEVSSAVAIVSDDGNRSSERLETIPTSPVSILRLRFVLIFLVAV